MAETPVASTPAPASAPPPQPAAEKGGSSILPIDGARPAGRAPGLRRRARRPRLPPRPAPPGDPAGRVLRRLPGGRRRRVRRRRQRHAGARLRGDCPATARSCSTWTPVETRHRARARVHHAAHQLPGRLGARRAADDRGERAGQRAAERRDDALRRVHRRRGASPTRHTSATPTAGVDGEAPPPVKGLRVNAENARVRVRWTPPAVEDLAEVVVVRRLGARAPTRPKDGTVVYRGLARTVTDFPVSPRARVWYAAFALDDDDNVSTPVTGSLPRFDPPLYAPLDGAVIRNTQLFRWRRVAGASYYNVQIWRGAAAQEGRLDVDERAELRPAAQARQGPLLLVRVPRLRAPLAGPLRRPARLGHVRRPLATAVVSRRRRSPHRVPPRSGPAPRRRAAAGRAARRPRCPRRGRRRPGSAPVSRLAAWIAAPRATSSVAAGTCTGAAREAQHGVAPGRALRTAADEQQGRVLGHAGRARADRRDGVEQPGDGAVVRRAQDLPARGAVPQAVDGPRGVRQVRRALAVEPGQHHDLAAGLHVVALEPEPGRHAVDGQRGVERAGERQVAPARRRRSRRRCRTGRPGAARRPRRPCPTCRARAPACPARRRGRGRRPCCRRCRRRPGCRPSARAPRPPPADTSPAAAPPAPVTDGSSAGSRSTAGSPSTSAL